MKKTKKRIPFYDKLIIVASTLIAIAFVVQLVVLNKLPMKFVAPVIIVLALIILGLNIILKSRKIMKVNKYLSRFLLVLLSVFLLIGNVYLFKTNSFFSNLIKRYDETHVSVYVRKSDPATKFEEVKDRVFFGTNIEGTLMKSAVEDYNKKLKTSISVDSKESMDELASSLLNSQVDVIFVNDALLSMFKDSEEEALRNFNDNTKKLYTYNQKIKLEDTSSLSLDKDPFTILISGIDTYGPISSSSRSDVNILLTVNPKTRTVLMVNTPRDYWVNLPCEGINQYDKLTHAGMYGASCSANAIGELYGIEVDYTLRVNFDSLIEIVDAIDGVNVIPTSTFSIGEYQFYAGVDTHMDGREALYFSRDRYNQEGGDRGRGLNQMLVVNAIINKLISPTIITNYLNILSAVDGSVETTLSQGDISTLVKKQLNSGEGWEIVSTAVDGAGAMDYTYSYPSDPLFVMVRYQETVDAATQAIQMVKEGKSKVEIEAILLH